MLALSPTIPTFLWPLEEPIIGHDQNYFCRETDTTATPISSFANFNSSHQPEIELLELDQSTAYNSGGDPNLVKKLNHNASERDRRKKMNTLYSSLRSLLPVTDQMKKLSIPATVSRVLKYIPELQQQVERLGERKEELITEISKQQDQQINHQENQRKGSKRTALSVVSASQLNDREVVIHISTYSNAHQTCPLSEVLLLLEEEGLSLINSSSFESFGARIFYTLHLQVEGAYRLQCEALSEKLVSLYEKREGFFPDQIYDG